MSVIHDVGIVRLSREISDVVQLLVKGLQSAPLPLRVTDTWIAAPYLGPHLREEVWNLYSRDRLARCVLEVQLDLARLRRNGVAGKLPQDESFGHEVRRQLIELALGEVPEHLLPFLAVPYRLNQLDQVE